MILSFSSNVFGFAPPRWLHQSLEFVWDAAVDKIAEDYVNYWTTMDDFPKGDWTERDLTMEAKRTLVYNGDFNNRPNYGPFVVAMMKLMVKKASIIVPSIIPAEIAFKHGRKAESLYNYLYAGFQNPSVHHTVDMIYEILEYAKTFVESVDKKEVKKGKQVKQRAEAFYSQLKNHVLVKAILEVMGDPEPETVPQLGFFDAYDRLESSIKKFLSISDEIHWPPLEDEGSRSKTEEKAREQAEKESQKQLEQEGFKPGVGEIPGGPVTPKKSLTFEKTMAQRREKVLYASKLLRQLFDAFISKKLAFPRETPDWNYRRPEQHHPEEVEDTGFLNDRRTKGLDEHLL